MPKAKLPNKEFEWTPELAYVIGLLVTDGCLSNDERHIIMRSSELPLLKTFKRCLNLSNRITETFNNGWSKKRNYRIQFCDVQFYRWLLKIGLFPAKTYTIGKINVPNKYFSDFLRGHLDGDGSVWTYKDYWNTFKNPKYIYKRLWTKFISASETHIKWLRKKIINLLDVKGYFWEQKPWMPYQTTSVWEIRFAKKESIKYFLNYITIKMSLV